jgi:HAMP domain-containing protein
MNLFLALEDVRVERGIVGTAYATEDALPRDLRKQIETLRTRSEAALDSALARLTPLSLDNLASPVERLRTARAQMAKLRPGADVYLMHVQYLRYPEAPGEWIAGVSDMLDALDNLSRRVEAELSQEDAFIANMVRVKQIIWSTRADTPARSLAHNATKDEEFARLAGRIDGAWQLVQDQARLEPIPAELTQAIEQANALYFSAAASNRASQIEQLSVEAELNVAPGDWLRLSAPRREATFVVSKTALDLAHAHALTQAKETEWDLYVASLLLVSSLGLGTVSGCYLWARLVRPIRQITSTMALVAEGDLSREVPFQERSDEIGSLARTLRVFRDEAVERQRRREARRQKSRAE